MNLFSINNLYNLPREMRDFIADYIDTINTFDFNVSTHRGAKDDLGIQNMDLWIEAYIDIFPQLEGFRSLVRTEMKRLNIDKHPNYAYDKAGNHYYYSNIKKIEKLRNLLSPAEENGISPREKTTYSIRLEVTEEHETNYLLRHIQEWGMLPGDHYMEKVGNQFIKNHFAPEIQSLNDFHNRADRCDCGDIEREARFRMQKKAGDLLESKGLLPKGSTEEMLVKKVRYINGLRIMLDKIYNK